MKKIIYIEQRILDHILYVPSGKGLKYETDNYIYYAIGGLFDDVSETKITNTMPTIKMTQTETVAYLKDMVFGLTDTGQAEKWVNFFIKVGMLEIKEKTNENYLTIKDMDGDIQKVDITELILKLNMAGFEVKFTGKNS